MSAAQAEQALATPLDDALVLDMAQLQPIAGIPGLYDEATRVVTERMTAMSEMRQQPAWSATELTQFSEHAHALKSGICMLGCARLALLCNKIEVLAREGRHQDGARAVQLFDTHFYVLVEESMRQLSGALE